MKDILYNSNHLDSYELASQTFNISGNKAEDWEDIVEENEDAM